MPLTSGTRLGPYEVLSAIGAGGMGEIYRARDTRLNRDVAIKVLPRLLAADESAVARFEREAKVLAALSHPNLLAIHDVGVQDRTAYAVMELLEGSSLREKLSDDDPRALPLRKVLDYGVQIARGLAAAHGKQIVHRDLKPENVFVTTDGRVKILDFGLAQQPDAVSSDDVTIAPATSPGTIMGTVGYMAPEQVRGEAVDHRGDIFAFGCVLYEMVAGRRAFQRPTPAETMTAILHDEPPPVSGPAELPPLLQSVISRCLEKEREERFQSASDLAFQLEHARDASGASQIVPAPATVPRRLVRAGIVAFAMAAAAAAGWLGRARFVTPTPPSASPVRFAQLTDLPGPERWPSLSPDGQSILYAGEVAGHVDIYLLRVGGRNPLNLTRDSGGANSQPAFSPDGSRIAFRSERSGGGIFVMGATGESVRRVTDFGFTPSWSPDASELVVSTAGFDDPFSRNIGAKLFAVTIATGDRRLIDDGDAVQPAWSPNGHRVAFWGTMGGGQRDIWTVPAAGPAAGPRVSVTTDAATDWYPRWSPDGRWLYFLSDRGGVMNVWRVRIEEQSGRVLGDAESVVAPAPAVSGITFARNGQMAYSTFDQRTTIEQLTLDPAREQIVGSSKVVLRGSRRITFLEWSPDAQWLAFSTIGARENVFLIRPDGSGYRQVTDDEFRNRGPAWSPDGSRIAFYSNRSGRYQIWSVNPDGSGLRQLTNVEESALTPVWSPAQDTLAVMWSTYPRGWRLFDVRTGKPILVPQLPGETPDSAYFQPLTWSTDGAFIAGVLTESQRSAGSMSGTYPVFIYSVRDRTFRRLDVSGGVRWMSDSRRLLVYDASEIAIVDTQTGRRKVILGTGGRQPSQFWGFSLTRDDRRLALLTDEVDGDLWAVRDR